MWLFKIIRNILTAIGLIFLSAGCISSPDRHDDNTVEVELAAPKTFSSYHDLFRYIAQNELIPRDIAPVDKNSIIKIAADSKIEICQPEDSMPTLYVIIPRYYLFSNDSLGVYDSIRGTQGNGTYYFVAASKNHLSTVGNPNPGFELVGIAIGNSYGFENVNHVTRIITTWHMGAQKNPENVYEWDGKVFKLKSELLKH